MTNQQFMKLPEKSARKLDIGSIIYFKDKAYEVKSININENGASIEVLEYEEETIELEDLQ